MAAWHQGSVPAAEVTHRSTSARAVSSRYIIGGTTIVMMMDRTVSRSRKLLKFGIASLTNTIRHMETARNVY